MQPGDPGENIGRGSCIKTGFLRHLVKERAAAKKHSPFFIGILISAQQKVNSFPLQKVLAKFTDQFVVELKIWHGQEYLEKGEEQIAAYLDYFHLDKGYLVSFNFNKNKKPGLCSRVIHGKTLVEIVV